MVRQSRHLASIDLTLRAGALGIGLLAAAWALSDILLIVFAAVLLACVLHGAADALHRFTRVGLRWTLLAVVAGASLSVAGLLWWRGAAIGGQAALITQQLTGQTQQLWQMLEASSWGSLLTEQLRRALSAAGRILTGYFPGVAGSALGIGGSLVVVVATAVFLAASPQLYLTGALRLLPVGWRKEGRRVATAVGKTLRLWFVGQFVDMMIVSTVVGAGLFFLGVPLALTLALIAGLFNFVPYVGALAGAVPAIIVALSQSPSQAAWVALLFASVQLLEGNVIAPMIQKQTARLPPALTILSQTILGSLFGLFGLVLATPLMAALLVSVRMIYVEGVLERPRDESASES